MGNCTRLTYTANSLWSEQPGHEDYGQTNSTRWRINELVDIKLYKKLDQWSKVRIPLVSQININPAFVSLSLQKSNTM